MSKYNLEEIHISNVKETMSADDQARFDNLTKDDQLKLEKIFSMMKAEKDAKKSTNEDFDSVVDKIKDSGKSEEDAKKIAGAINAKYVGNYREGVEESDAADYTEEIAEENDEDKLPMDELEEGAMQPGEGDLESGQTGNMDAYTEEIKGGKVSMKDAVLAIIKDTSATNPEIQMYVDSLTNDIKLNGKEAYADYEVDDYIEDFKEFIGNKSLQEHFGRFMKDFQ